MKWFRIALILIVGTALLLSLMSSWRDRQELRKVTAANEFLRKSLGEMAVALAACPPTTRK
jgi:type II secretory pathway pseudopilin PulG